MSIDVMKQVGTSGAGAASGSSPAKPAAPEARQELPGSGNVVPSPEAEVATQSEVRRAISRLNDYIQTLRRDLRFTIDEESGRSVVRVIDSETGDLIRQIPSEEVLAIAQALSEVQAPGEGIIFSDKA